MSDDPFAQLKAAQREGWAVFAPLEAVTTIPAAELVRHARIGPPQAVLDVGCGTGVMAYPALSPQHYRKRIEETLGPVVRLAAFRAELDAFIAAISTTIWCGSISS